MKNNAQVRHHFLYNFFNQPPNRRFFPHLPSKGFANFFLTYKEQFTTGLATLAIGTVLLLSIYLFLIQLAKYGW